MKYLRNIVTWIASLETGGEFRKWISILVKILGVLTLIGAIVWGIAICVGSIVASEYMGTSSRTFVIIGTILSLCINIIVGLILIMLFWNRSNLIRTLSEKSHFSLMPIAVVLIRLVGEFSFLALVGAGIQMLISSIFGVVFPNLLSIFISELGRDVNFIVGAISFVISAISGAILLVFYYFIAERISLFVDMATHLKKIEKTLSTEEESSDSDDETPSDS